jgi:zinc transporter ZupT
MSNNPEFTPEMRDVFERLSTSSGARFLSVLVTLVLDSIFGMLGGLIGVAVFKRNLPPAPPPGTIDIPPSPIVPPPPPPPPPPAAVDI